MAKDCMRLKVAAWSRVLQSGSKADIPLSSSFDYLNPVMRKLEEKLVVFQVSPNQVISTTDTQQGT